MSVDPRDGPSLDVVLGAGRNDAGGARRISGRLAIRDASAQLASGASRELVIFSRDLDPHYYDHQPFLAEVQRLALERPHLPVRALVMQPRVPVTHGHRLIDLARRLTSRIEIRRTGNDDRDRADAFIVADMRAYCLRRLADRHEAIHDPDDPAGARCLRAEFERMWEQGEPDTELRRLHL